MEGTLFIAPPEATVSPLNTDGVWWWTPI